MSVLMILLVRSHVNEVDVSQKVASAFTRKMTHLLTRSVCDTMVHQRNLRRLILVIILCSQDKHCSNLERNDGFDSEPSII